MLAAHKIIAVCPIAFLAVCTHNASTTVALAALSWIVLASVAVALLGALVTGGWMTVSEPASQIISALHRLSAYLAVPLAVAAFFLLRSSR